jgi:hypothetical protein
MKGAAEPHAGRRLVRVCYFNTWADGLEDAAKYLAHIFTQDLRARVTNPRNSELLRKARLDCDWYAENARCFAAMKHPEMEFLPAWVTGKEGLVDVARRPREPGEERWLITMAHQPQSLGPLAGKTFDLLSRAGVRQLFYAFDEASRFMPCFADIAPSLDVLIHDEWPLAEAGRARLRATCLTVHRSWVANVIPAAAPFNEAPEEKIHFLGSPMGLTPHRRRQIEFLRRRFKDRVVASCDHTTSVAGRMDLNRFKVGLCPEGRKFTTPAMQTMHTDRPFWSGCLGMVPVSEDSRAGGRLEPLHQAGLIVRYDHGDLDSLASACEHALAMSANDRRKIHEHFNRHETVGTVVADAIAAARVYPGCPAGRGNGSTSNPCSDRPR